MNKAPKVISLKEWKQKKTNKDLSADEVASLFRQVIQASRLASSERKLSSIVVWSMIGFLVVTFMLGLIYPKHSYPVFFNQPHTYPIKQG